LEELAAVKRDRGSALLMCLLLVMAVATVIFAECDLTTAGIRAETQAERRRIADYAFDGAIAQIVDQYYNDTLTLPSTLQVNLGGASGTVTVSDNSATLPRTLAVSGQLSVAGVTYSESRVVGARHPPSVFFYALAVSGSLTSDQALFTGASEASGDVLCGGNVSLTATGNVVNGDLESAGSISDASTTVTGSVLPYATSVTFPAVTGFNYESAATATFTDPAMDGYVFPSGSPYALVYCAGDLSIQGAFSGKGTIYVAGNVNVVGDMSYSDASSEVVIIAGGDIAFGSSVTDAVGYLFTPSAVQIPGGLTITRGAVVAGSIQWSGTLSIAGDPYVWDYEAEGAALKLPGMWP
jgi:hypothetical protein